LLQAWGVSRRGNCYDNDMMKSFRSTVKRELVHRLQFATRKEAHSAIFEWIEIFYNGERLHSVLGFKSPVDFETMSEATVNEQSGFHFSE
jgi:putative transposase